MCIYFLWVLREGVCTRFYWLQKNLNRSIWPKDGTLTAFSAPGQNRSARILHSTDLHHQMNFSAISKKLFFREGALQAIGQCILSPTDRVKSIKTLRWYFSAYLIYIKCKICWLNFKLKCFHYRHTIHIILQQRYNRNLLKCFNI